MACAMDNKTEESNGDRVLLETKSFQQARERTFLSWPLGSYPCRMKMKKAGWFIIRNTDGILVAVCLYCKKSCKGWNREHDPYKVHKFLSPECVFVLYAQNIQTPPSPIIESMPRRERVRPSLHAMAVLPTRIKSFEQWPIGSPHPPFDTLAEAGLFYNGQNTMVECFFCHGHISIFHPDDNSMLAHTNRCQYAKHLKGHSQRVPLDIRASDKVYVLDAKLVNNNNNTIFYVLQCVTESTPGILLSANIVVPNGQELEISDKNFKRLRPSDQLQQKVNWATSSDGPLVNILKDLANNSLDLTTIPQDIKYFREVSSISSTNTTNDLAFQCKTCLTTDASPHIVPIKCCHRGLCSRECFLKWMTCVICGYTLGKAMRIYAV